MSYQEPERMRLHVFMMFEGKDPSVGLAHPSPSERKKWAQHWWEREVKFGRYGDRGWIMDIYPTGQIIFKSILECYADGKWETDPPGTAARVALQKLIENEKKGNV